MKTVYKICLINIALAMLFAFLFSIDEGKGWFIPVFGLVCVFSGAINILIGLVLLLFKRREWGQGCLLSAGILLLIGLAVCSLVRVA